MTEGEYGRVEGNIDNALTVTRAVLLRQNNTEKDKADPATRDHSTRSR
jgi:hypothetical protein